MRTSWKTTLMGLAAIFSVVAKLLNDPASLEPTDIAAVTTGVGLIVAKDAAVTGVHR
jgi:hypothetical protein